MRVGPSLLCATFYLKTLPIIFNDKYADLYYADIVFQVCQQFNNVK